MRLTAFLLSIYILLSSLGLGANMHYCLGSISEVGMLWEAVSCVCEDFDIHDSDEDGCCDDESIIVLLDIDSISPTLTWYTISENPVLTPPIFGFGLFEDTLDITVSALFLEQQANGLPLPIDRVTLYHKYLFYG